MLETLRSFERMVVVVLTVLLGVVIGLATIELAVHLVWDIVSPPFGLLDVEELLDIFGLFLLVLIGLELLETMKAYLAAAVVRAEVVFLVALIALARKVIILDPHKLPAETIAAVAFSILALAAGYWLVRRSHAEHGPPSAPPDA